MNLTRSIVLAAVAAAGVFSLAACKLPGDAGTPAAQTASPAPSVPASAAPDPSPSASGKGTGKATGKATGSAKASSRTGLPDVCTLLSRAEVSALTGGKQIVQIDPDGATAADSVRHCQWQLSGARVALFLSKTTNAQFDSRPPGTKPVTGVGEDAYLLAGHLYIRYHGLQVDIYTSSGGTEATELQLQKAIAAKVLPRL